MRFRAAKLKNYVAASCKHTMTEEKPKQMDTKVMDDYINLSGWLIDRFPIPDAKQESFCRDLWLNVFQYRSCPDRAARTSSCEATPPPSPAAAHGDGSGPTPCTSPSQETSAGSA
jgi:hypothetical protein